MDAAPSKKYPEKTGAEANPSQKQVANANAARNGKDLIAETEEFNRAVLDSLSDHIAVLDKNGQIITCQ